MGKMDKYWLFLVLMTLLIIGGVELNPGPMRKRSNLTNKKLRQNQKEKYLQQSRKTQILPTDDDEKDQEISTLENTLEKTEPIDSKYNSSKRKKRTLSCNLRKSRTKRHLRYCTNNMNISDEDLHIEKQRRREYMKQWRLSDDVTTNKADRAETKLRVHKLRTLYSYRHKENCMKKKKTMSLRSDVIYRQKENCDQKDIKTNLRSTDVYRQKENIKQKEIKRKLRSSDVYRQKENVKQKDIKTILRSTDVYRQKENVNQKDIKRNLRTSHVYKQKENINQNDIKRKLRSNDVYRQKENVNQKDIKTILRSSDIYRQKENVNQKDIKRNLRTSDVYKQKENISQKDIKRNLRSSDVYKQKGNINQKDIKRNLRSSDVYKQKENINQKDIKRKLRSNDVFRKMDNEKQLESKHILRSVPEFSKKEKQKGMISKRDSRRKLSNLESDITYIKEKFLKSLQCGPIYVCSCCKRMLYRHSVVHVPSDRYKNLKTKRTIINNCLTSFKSLDNMEWICKTCHQTIKKEKMPAQAECNELFLEAAPFELADLCPLEERLVSLRIPFMQIVNLPRGSQRGIHGPAVNVPTTLDSILSILPRLPSQYGFVPVKLKRKLMYRGHVMHQSIRPNHVMAALSILKDIHPQYSSVNVNSEWIQQSFKEDDDLASHLIEITEGIHDMQSEDNDSESDNDKENDKTMMETKDEEDPMSKLRGFPYNTCMQPSSYIYTGKETISFAPGEGQHPISFFQDKDCETLAFPTLFPNGKFGLNTKDRTISLSMKRYFNQRILNVDSRFASNIEYLFLAQYMCEAKQILDNINIAMKKGSGGANRITAEQICRADGSDSILSQNEGFRFLQTVRGSYPYWMKTLNDLNAMVRQLDIPTWFCSFSSADLKWPEVITIIAQQHGLTLKDEDVLKMNWQEKCLWIKRNPFTVARHFEYRVNRFLHDVLMSSAQPIGKITDYFIRTEFQQRGSPHIHCLFWIDDAPKLGKDDDFEVTKFIDRYISAQIPSIEDDPELFDLVTTLQKHTHSHTCRKNNESCRFHYPKPPSEFTLIAAQPSINDYDPPALITRKNEIKIILHAVYEAVKSNPERTLKDILGTLNIKIDVYTKALKESTHNETIIYKRQPIDTCTNNYNPALMKIWSANLDIQFVTNAYACAMYILSYVSKDERQMGDLLRSTAKECSKNDTLRKQLKTLGNVFLTHRELSAQEAVYRVLPLPLKHSSRTVVFVNTGLPDERIYILKSLQKLQSLPSDSEDIFAKNIIDRYTARPNKLQNICLADFATLYRLKGDKTTDEENEDNLDEAEEIKTETATKDIILKKEMGIMAKRKMRAILRYPRFSSTKSPERHFHSKLMLYYPWTNETVDLKGKYSTYAEFFETVNGVVLQNQSIFEHCSEDLDIAVQNVDKTPESAWNDLFSDQQQQHYDEEYEKLSDDNPQVLNEDQTVPEMETKTVKPFSVEVCRKQLTDSDYYSTVRSLNEEQRTLFEKILKWCRDSVIAEKRNSFKKPFYTFVTGGAGTGKSHLIKTIVAMIERELRPILDSPDKQSVLLTAPTGIAAANIDGITIHTAFSIPINCNTNNYTGLSNEKLASLRNAMENLRVVIIDEISMVGLSLLTSVHKRLQDIKGITDKDMVFGGISILAVGDFYQLEPVKQKPVFATSSDLYESLNPNHIWKDYFQLYELTEVMRQKEDAEFSCLLNRARIGKLTENDANILKSRIVTEKDEKYPHNALHVFPTNALVDNHNMKMLQNMNSQPVIINSVDSKKDIHTNKAQIVNLPDDPSLTGGLSHTLVLAIGARVMLTKNIDVSDALVNGMQGKVVGFRYNDNNSKNQVMSIQIMFDSKDVGLAHRKKHPSVPGAVSIFREESKFFLHKKGAIEVNRKQFPLKLCFASTIHKVQGLSMDNIVVSFEGQMRAGQGYVALSRARTLSGLYFQNFEVKKIKTSKSVEDEMTRLKQQSQDTQKMYSKDVWTKICHINARSLQKHRDDLKTCTDVLSYHAIFISETWMNENSKTSSVQLPGFKFYRRDRCSTYKNHVCLENCPICNNKGGIGLYAKDDIAVTILPDNDTIECMFVQLTLKNKDTICIGLVYRPQYIPVTKICLSFTNHIEKLDLKTTTVILLGDFNIDYQIQRKSILTTTLEKSNFRQIIDAPTHVSGSIIDHVYTNNNSPLLQSGVMPCYFSDHNFTYCILPTPGNQADVQNIHTTTEVKPKQIYKEKVNIVNSKFTRKCTNISKSMAKSNVQIQDDIQLVAAQENTHFIQSFHLPTNEDSLTVANQLLVKLQHDPVVRQELYDIRYTGYLRNLRQHTCPCIIDGISSDGNCFFRAISKQLLGTEKYHQRLRHLICDFEDTHKNTFIDWRGSGLDGLQDHITQMRRPRVWATEVELLATATLFHTSIWQFTAQYIDEFNRNWKWIEIKSLDIHPNDHHDGQIPINGNFYIHHTFGIHYDCIYPHE